MDIVTFSMHMSYFCRNRAALVSAGDAVVGFSVLLHFLHNPSHCCTFLLHRLCFAAFAHLLFMYSCVIVCHSAAGSLHCVLYHWLDLIFLDV